MDLKRLKMVGDPLADAAIAEATSLGAQGNLLLDRAVTKGVDEQTPPAARALIEDACKLDWTDMAQLRRGSEAYLSAGGTVISLSLGPGSLAHTYSSPSIARLLVKTGNLTEMALRRLLETGAWRIAAVIPDGLLPGNDGYLHSMKVRLLHARVRYGVRKQGWDEAVDGVPINQVDMIRTWLDFTYVPLTALKALGVSFTKDEIRDIYHLWQAAAHILGVDDTIVRTIDGQESAKRLLDAIHDLEGPPNEDSRRLTAAMIAAVGQLLAPGMKVSQKTGEKIVAASLRRIHGRAMAKALGVPWNWTALLLPFAAILTSIQHNRERKNPALRAKTVAAAMEFHFNRDKIIPGQTTYERAAMENAALGPPVTEKM